MTAMANKRTRRTKIGLGDDVVEDWKGRCGPEIEIIIKEVLERVGEEEIKVDWSEVLAGIPGISTREVKRLHIEGKYDIINYWKCFRELTSSI
jgi:hypothetical protein